MLSFKTTRTYYSLRDLSQNRIVTLIEEYNQDLKSALIAYEDVADLGVRAEIRYFPTSMLGENLSSKDWRLVEMDTVIGSLDLTKPQVNKFTSKTSKFQHKFQFEIH